METREVRQARRGVRQAAKSVNGRLLIFVIVAVVLSAFSVFAYANVTQSNQADRELLTLCRAQNESRMTLRNVLTILRARSTIPNAAYWEEALALVGPIPCKKIVTKGAP